MLLSEKALLIVTGSIAVVLTIYETGHFIL
jgi:hypothetical protein